MALRKNTRSPRSSSAPGQCGAREGVGGPGGGLRGPRDYLVEHVQELGQLIGEHPVVTVEHVNAITVATHLRLLGRRPAPRPAGYMPFAAATFRPLDPHGLTPSQARHSELQQRAASPPGPLSSWPRHVLAAGSGPLVAIAWRATCETCHRGTGTRSQH